jgi:NAD+ kinase
METEAMPQENPLTPVLKHITMVHNISTDPNNIYRDKVRAFLESRHVAVSVITVESKDCPVIPEGAQLPDLVIVLGGDGTFLRASLTFAKHDVPLVGINTGTLGFLTRIEVDRFSLYLDRLLKGEYELEERMMLVVDHGDQLALNDVVIKNANPSQMCSLRFYINETLVAVYDADGIIVSTPTGSTAYTLSAGGPVISPEVEALSITAICPHSLSAKPVIIPADKQLRVESAPKNRDVVYAIDGQETGMLKPGESITIVRSPLSVKMVNFRMEEDNFYLLLKKKLHWGMNPRWKTPG